jgi:hypothetical protein
VKQKRDLGCKSAREVTTVEEKKGTLGNARQFWDLLGGHKPYMGKFQLEVLLFEVEKGRLYFIYTTS